MIQHKQQTIIPHNGESGFTIIESLIAMLVASVLLVSIAPVIVLGTATRVQARRIELGTQAARTYIDGVRTGVISAPLETGASTDLASFAAPTTASSLSCDANSYCTTTASSVTPTNLYCMDLDSLPAIAPKCESSSSKDMVLQVFRYNKNNNNSNNATAGYQLGVRVYRADGFRSDGDLKAPSKQATFTGGLGDRKAPLLEMTTAINPQTNSFNDLCNRLKNVSNAAANSSCN
ncbi:type II secretion system protein [Calothrix sp. FACHB-156]|nr:type II secretion system protein [Calothrix sp. FACHB-156]